MIIIRPGYARTLSFAMLTVMIGSSLAHAQAKPDLPTLRKTALSDQTARESVAQWLNAQVAQLYASEEPLRTGADLYRELKMHLRASDAGTEFKNALVELLAAAFNDEYQPPADGQPNPKPIPAVYTLAAMNLHPHAAALPVYRRALQDTSSGVRLVSAEGLLLARIPNDEWNTLFPIVEQLAVNETSPATLDRLWRLMVKNDGPQGERVIPALLNVLEARCTRFEKKNTLPSIVDGFIIDWLRGPASRLQDAALKKRVVGLAGRVLADAVHTYVEVGPDKLHRERIERLILMTETALKEITGQAGPSPDVTTAMTNGGEQQESAMNQALVGWIGNAERDGVLNGAPFNLEKGLAIERPEPEKPEAGAGTPVASGGSSADATP